MYHQLESISDITVCFVIMCTAAFLDRPNYTLPSGSPFHRETFTYFSKIRNIVPFRQMRSDSTLASSDQVPLGVNRKINSENLTNQVL